MDGADLTEPVIGAAIAVHRELGPGLLESVYEECLAHELQHRAIPHVRQLEIPVRYRGLVLEAGFRLDFLIADRLVLELKSVERLLPLHPAQVLTYMRMSGHRLGLLLNFNTVRLIDGLRRFVL